MRTVAVLAFCVVFPHMLWADNPTLRLGAERSRAQEVALVYLDNASWQCPPPFKAATLTAS